MMRVFEDVHASMEQQIAIIYVHWA